MRERDPCSPRAGARRFFPNNLFCATFTNSAGFSKCQNLFLVLPASGAVLTSPYINLLVRFPLPFCSIITLRRQCMVMLDREISVAILRVMFGTLARGE